MGGVSTSEGVGYLPSGPQKHGARPHRRPCGRISLCCYFRAPWQAREKRGCLSSLLHSFWLGSSEGGRESCTCAVWLTEIARLKNAAISEKSLRHTASHGRDCPFRSLSLGPPRQLGAATLPPPRGHSGALCSPGAPSVLQTH